ncbi:hypothetical protein HPULCUR_003363 [Helicostylum pulchrum]|uniref:Uncharacterized protein n=1 Tax=Helicostylum pulchrum TaxID=562976 RepID=A0ABP9XUG3_9FUNG
MTTFNINNDFIIPPYEDCDGAIVHMSFENEVEFDYRFDNGPKKHCNWLKKETVKTTEGVIGTTAVALRVSWVCTHNERTDPEVLRWIAKHVEEHHMDWKYIKNVLRLNESKVDDVNVQNVIANRLNRISRKHANVYRSVDLWMDYLREKQYSAEYVQHSGKETPSLMTNKSFFVTNKEFTNVIADWLE